MKQWLRLKQLGGRGRAALLIAAITWVWLKEAVWAVIAGLTTWVALDTTAWLGWNRWVQKHLGATKGPKEGEEPKVEMVETETHLDDTAIKRTGGDGTTRVTIDAMPNPVTIEMEAGDVKVRATISAQGSQGAVDRGERPDA